MGLFFQSKVKIVTLFTRGTKRVNFQRPIDKIEAQVIELKPKALIMGAGLHFVKEGKSRWEKYKGDLRLRLHELVNISKKVMKTQLYDKSSVCAFVDSRN